MTNPSVDSREDVQTLGFACLVRIDQNAKRFRGAAADAAAQLVQLRQPVPLRVEDDHDACVGDVDADFDDRRRDQNVDLAARRIAHDVVFFARRHPAVQQPDPQIRKYVGSQALRFGHGARQVAFSFLDRRRNDVGLMPAFHVRTNELVDRVQAGCCARQTFRSASVPAAARR